MSRKDEGRNVADYETVKAVLFTEYYDLLRQVNALDTDKMHEGKSQYREIVDVVENRLFFLANIGGASKNLSPDVVKKILGVQPDKDELTGDVGLDLSRYDSKQDLMRYLKRMVTKISLDMGETGFLDTRLDEDMVTERSDDLEDFFLDKKPAIYDR